MKPNLLLVDDEPAILALFSNYLSGEGYDVKAVNCLQEAKDAITSQQFNAVILDLILPRVLAGEEISREDIIELGHGGLCLNCESCSFPACPFGK